MIARSLIFLGLATTLVAAVPRAAAAETWPDRSLAMVVPFPPGGPTDAQALGTLHRAAIEKWWPIIRAANIKAD